MRARHGTRSMYVYSECRCAACVQANRDYQRDYLRKRIAAGLVDEHGKRKDRANVGTR